MRCIRGTVLPQPGSPSPCRGRSGGGLGLPATAGASGGSMILEGLRNTRYVTACNVIDKQGLILNSAAARTDPFRESFRYAPVCSAATSVTSFRQVVTEKSWSGRLSPQQDQRTSL